MHRVPSTTVTEGGRLVLTIEGASGGFVPVALEVHKHPVMHTWKLHHLGVR